MKDKNNFNLNENLYKYFLYRLIDRVLLEIKVEIDSDYPRIDKINSLLNFIVDLPLELHRMKGNNSYELLFMQYKTYSKKLKISKWFDTFFNETYEVYLRRTSPLAPPMSDEPKSDG